MTAINLRDYQIECLEKIEENFNQGNKSVLVSLPTGSGKTVIFASLIKRLKKPTLVLAHREELIRQAVQRIRQTSGIEPGILDAQNKGFNSYILVSSTQSLQYDKNLDIVASKDFQLIIYDEAHHLASEGSRKIIERLKSNNQQPFLLGLTATPVRADGKGLGSFFDAVAYEKDIRDLVEAGYLVRPKAIKVINNLNLGDVKTYKGDFSLTSLSDVMNTPKVNAMIVNTFLEKAKEKKTVVFTTSVNHAENITHLLRENGIKATTISGNTPRKIRKDKLHKFSAGEIQVICNCNVLTEGFDEPSIECIIVARPTRSTALYIQMVGRGLRKISDKKECLILDFGDKNHSLATVAVLFENNFDRDDEEKVYKNQERVNNEKELELDKELEVCLREYDPMGRFRWEKDSNSNYILKTNTCCLNILREVDDTYSVAFKRFKDPKITTLGFQLSLEDAFNIAEDYAKDVKSLKALDSKAKWNSEPISQRQLSYLKGLGFKHGIEKLTKGKAATIISSLSEKR